MTRAFVALPLPERLRSGLATVLSALPAGRPVDDENMHLTLVFLGDQDDATLEEVHDALSAITAPGFTLRLSGLGAFGGAHPRSLWIGVAPEPGLVALQKRVARAVRGVGVRLAARRFVPHVTLARFREGFVEDAAFTRFVAAHAGLTMPEFSVSIIGLYASTLTASGPIYEELSTYPLDMR